MIRVMTFNIRGSFHRQDGTNAWANRRALNLQTIEKCNADIIGFQEVQSGNLEAYQECDYLRRQWDGILGHNCKRSMNWSFLHQDLYDRCWKQSKSVPSALANGVKYFSSNVGSSSQQDEYSPIYWKRDRFDRIDHGSFYLSPTPDVESIGWNSKLLRAATWVRLREKETGANVLVLNTHFPHENGDGEITRNECAMVILQQLAAISTSTTCASTTIVMGDFNCHASPKTPAYATFCANGYQDTCSYAHHHHNRHHHHASSTTTTMESGGGRMHTFHNFQGDNYCRANSGRIDWILYQNHNDDTANGYGSSNTKLRYALVPAGPARVMRDAEPPLYPSDHYPVVVDFSVRTVSKG